MNVIAFDIDGVLADYGYSNMPKINVAFLDEMKSEYGSRVAFALVSNQGGLPFGVQSVRLPDGNTYPVPLTCARRLYAVSMAFRHRGMNIAHVRYCVFHPTADRTSIQTAAKELRFHIGRHADHFGYSWHVYSTQAARKPNPLMLLSVGASAYYGDSDEDEQAAQAARIPFHRVRRFTGN